MPVVRELRAGMADEVHDALDVRDVAGNIHLQRDAKPVVGTGRRRGSRGHDVGGSGEGRWPGDDAARPALPGDRAATISAGSEAGQRAVARV